jgi:hypothetical protein
MPRAGTRFSIRWPTARRLPASKSTCCLRLARVRNYDLPLSRSVRSSSLESFRRLGCDNGCDQGNQQEGNRAD